MIKLKKTKDLRKMSKAALIKENMALRLYVKMIDRHIIGRLNHRINPLTIKNEKHLWMLKGAAIYGRYIMVFDDFEKMMDEKKDWWEVRETFIRAAEEDDQKCLMELEKNS